MTRPLSPAAQAVLDAFLANWEDEPRQQDRRCLAAAIRALVDQVTQMRPHGLHVWTTEQAVAYEALSRAADHHTAIAAELEGMADG